MKFISLLLLLPTACPLALTPSLAGSSETAAVSSRVVWFQDHTLRVRDNDALDAAFVVAANAPCKIFPVYLWRSSPFEPLDPVDIATGGTASDVFVANALGHLNRTLCGRLSLGIVESSKSTMAQARFYADELAHVCQLVGTSEVYYTESHNREFENALRENIQDHGLVPMAFGGGHTLLDYSKKHKAPPWKEIIEEHPFRSPLIPFVDYVLDKLKDDPPAQPKPEPMGLEESIATQIPFLPGETMVQNLATHPLAISDLLNAVGYTQSRNHWGSSIEKAWPASEEDAARALASFLDSLRASSPEKKGCADEAETRKRTHLASRLSPYLARGILSPKQVYHALLPSSKESASFVRRICWRDYTYAVLALFPDVVSGRPIREGYYEEEESDDSMTETNRNNLLQLWKDGSTGFPLVDAGMRQLSAEGWMPQKVRLSVSTCLVEGLGGSWKEGMDHFAEYLVDYDPAINANMWMNAGCVGFDPYYVGTDYKRRPYWDKDGEYVRKWCPELSNLPDSWEVAEAQRGIGTFGVDCLYEPWSSPGLVLDQAGVVLGETYPHRCCDERSERKRFFQELRNRRATWSVSMTDGRGRDMVPLGRHPDCESIGMFTPRALLVAKPSSTKEGTNH